VHMPETTILINGAGSTTFTPRLMADLAMSEILSGVECRLYDILPEPAHNMARIGARMAEATGSDVQFEAVQDRPLALKGADFVIQSIAVGGLEAWQHDIEIPRRHGIEQTVGDTVGPGGLSRALRVLPPAVELAREMEESCPDAVLFNYSNPMTALCRAVTRETSVQTVGLCHGIDGTLRTLASFVGWEPDQVTCTAAGINHFTWILELRHGTEDGYLALREAAAEVDELPHPLSFRLMEVYGCYPSPGDRHVCEFLPFFCRTDDSGQMPYGLAPFDMQARIEGKEQAWQRFEAAASGETPIEEMLTPSGEAVIAMIEAMVGGCERVFLAVNVPNDGCIAGLPDLAVVEVPAAIGALGLRPIRVGELPAGITATIAARVYQIELTVEAALRGDRGVALQALLADEQILDFDAAGQMLDELLTANADHLPQFA
jgi:alpha-galactosidase